MNDTPNKRLGVVIRVFAHRFVATLITAAFALFIVVPSSAPVHAASTQLGITLVHQELALNPDANLVLSVKLDQALPAGATIVLTSYRPLKTRADLTDAIAGKLPRSLDTVDLPLEAISFVNDVITFTVPTESSRRTSRALQFSQQGLFPVVLDIQGDSGVAGELTTFVDRLPKEGDDPRGTLNVALAVSLSAPPAIPGSDTALLPATAQELSDLNAFPAAIPLTVALSPEILDRVDGPNRDNLRNILNANYGISQPRIPFDPSAAVAANNSALFTQLLREGENAISALGETPPSDRSIWWSWGQLTTPGASLVRDLGARLLVLSPNEYANAKGSLGPGTDTTQLLMTTLPDATSVPTLVLDAAFADRLASTSPPTELGAIYAAADLVATRDQLAAATAAPMSGHTMVIGLSGGGVPNPAFVSRIQSMSDATGATQFVTLNGVERTTTTLLVDGLPVDIELPTITPVDIAARLTSLDQLKAHAFMVSGMLVNARDRPNRWQATIAVLASSALTDEAVAKATTALNNELASVTGAVSPRPIYAFTLSGRRTTIRLRIENISDEPLRVMVRLTANKLTFPKGDQVVTIEAQSITDVAVPVVARTNGSFPVSLDVLSPDGGLPLVNTFYLKARVSALTGVAQLLTGGGLLMLLAWWGRNLRAGRRAKHNVVGRSNHPVARTNGGLVSDEPNSANVSNS
ncbi:MAG: hypothetical protein WCK14_08700 [Actinomycetota bacterium]